jgi:hypothetical protein
MFVVVAALTVAQPAVGQDGVPEGLSASDWSSIRSAYEANRHAAYPVQDGYLARNPGQQWQTHFDGRGFLITPDHRNWTWGLQLVSYGREGDQVPVETPTCIDAQGQRVEYQWDEKLTEWYINDPRGLEHGYTVHERLDAHRLETGATPSLPLRLTLAVRGEVRPRVSRDGRDVTFISNNGAAVVHYTSLTVFDADGVNVPAWFEPAGRGLRLSVDDAGARYPLTIDPIAQQAYLKASNTEGGPIIEGGDFFGISVAADGDTVVVGAYNEDSSATGVNGNQADNSAIGSGAAYVFVRDAGGVWSQEAYLKASNTDSEDTFGISVAISGDTVVVGAPNEASNAAGVNGNQTNNLAPGSGAAYVFVRNGATWDQQAYLKASNTNAGDNFGISAAVSTDTIVVGARFEASSATGVNGDQMNNHLGQAGAAYVFVREGITWSQQAYLKASNTDFQDWFGSSVAVSGDTVVVGAFFEASSATGVNGNQADNSASLSGAAYIFRRNSTSWSQEAYLKASNSNGSDRFGQSVAVAGEAVVVGAPGEDSGATGVNGDENDNSASASGAAYVFDRNFGNWTQQAYLKSSNTNTGDGFGVSVAIDGNTVLVGAQQEQSNATGINGDQRDNSASNAGAAYIFTRNGETWNQLAYLKASNTDPGDHFGISVGVSGETVVVGAFTEDSSATGVGGEQRDNSALSSGAAYVFEILLCAILADLDADFDVDHDDFTLLFDCLAGPDVENLVCDLNEFGNEDLDGDGDIDLADFAEFQLMFGQSCL